MTNITRPNDDTEKLAITFTKSILARINHERGDVQSNLFYTEPVHSSRLKAFCSYKVAHTTKAALTSQSEQRYCV
jgi:hypothetical protein